MCVGYIVFVNRNVVLELFLNFKSEFYFLILILLYSILRDLFVGAEVLSFRFLAWFFQAFVFGFMLIKFFGNNYAKLFMSLYWASVLAAIFSLLLVLFPSLDDLYKVIKLEEVDIYENMEVRHRAFGISENLTFTYSFVLGFFAGYTLIILNENKLLIIPFLLLSLGVMYNARIGLLPILISFAFLIFSGSLKNLGFFILLSLIVLFSIYSFNPVLYDRVLFNQEWVLEFFYEISDSLFGTNMSVTNSMTLDLLTDKFIVLPQTLFSWIFGTGEFLFTKAGMNSDIGYIIQLYYGGLILTILLGVLNILFFFRLIRLRGFSDWFTVVFVLSVLALNFKGFLFAATPGGRMLFLLYMCFILSSKKEFRSKLAF